ncbi:AAA family ATPase [Luteococcus sp. H138]|uniref:AAA family ATPase n=1 Tax=unclassified Luteococcus TaxID=2639923 RepID=UPI00313B0258
MQTTAWHVNSLNLTNFRAYESLRIDFETDLTVLVGLNAEGKTSVLDALAISLGSVIAGFGQTAPGFQTHDAHAKAHNLDSWSSIATLEQAYPIRAELAATIAGEHYSWTRERRSSKGRTTWGDNGVRAAVQRLAEEATAASHWGVTLPVIGYYGVERLVGVRRDQGSIPTSRLGAYAAALDPKSDLTRLGNYLKSLMLRAAVDLTRDRPAPAPVRAQLDAIDAATHAALADFGWHRPIWDPMVGTITLTPTTGGATLPLDWLSSGVRITAGLVIDLASRMARANPHLGGDDLLKTTPGIVLIDEVDLHLHPQWQQRIIGILRETFPKVQFIVTTHSPQVLSTVPARCIRILSDKQALTPLHSEGLRSDIVLQAIQETTPEPPTQNRKKLDDYLSLVHKDQGETPKALGLRRELEEEMGGVSLVPELGEADAYMAIFGDE